MFQGIASQISDAQKEIYRQGNLKNLAEKLEKYYKKDIKTAKKTRTALSKYTFPNIDLEKVDQLPSLKSLFFVIFTNQDYEKDASRSSFLEQKLLQKVLSKSSLDLVKELEKVKPILKLNREVNSLQNIIKKIKTSTIQKYYYQEVSTMFQFVEKSAKLRAHYEALQDTIEAGTEVKTILQRMIKTLKNESNWGSWETFYSKKSDPFNIPPSYVDAAMEDLPVAHAKMHVFEIMSEQFSDNRDMELNLPNLEGFAESFIHNLVQDWITGAKVKTTLSKCNRVLSSVNIILHRLNALKSHCSNEIELIDLESSTRIEKTEAYVQKKLEEKS